MYRYSVQIGAIRYVYTDRHLKITDNTISSYSCIHFHDTKLYNTVFSNKCPVLRMICSNALYVD